MCVVADLNSLRLLCCLASCDTVKPVVMTSSVAIDDSDDEDGREDTSTQDST